MDHFDLYQCRDKRCDRTGILASPPEGTPDISEPCWIPCPACGAPMGLVRRANEDEIQSPGLLTRYGRLGPIFSIRTDGPAFDGPAFGSIDVVVEKGARQNAPSRSEDADSDVIFTPEAATLLKATESRTTYLARTGVIPAFKVGKKEWRYSRKSLVEWVLNQARKGLDLPWHLPEPAHPKQSAKSKVSNRRNNIPTDLNPDALRSAIKSIRPTGE